MRGCFGWEYKGKRKDLKAAYVQLQQYAVALENPPLLIVCDLDRFRIHTNWTNTVQHVYDIDLQDLHDPAKRDLLKAVFSDPDRLKPGRTREALTEEAAERFAALALRLRGRGHEAQAVAHFVNRLVFCMFAEDVGLLPGTMFTRMLEGSLTCPAEFSNMAQELFRAMKAGGRVGFEHVDWFNGGLFDTDDALPLEKVDVDLVLKAARLDWSDIEPSILGTLFERGLDPDKRSQLGAHYTDRQKIMMLVEPVIIRPLEAEWSEVKAKIDLEIKKARSASEKRPERQSDARKVYAAARRAEERAMREARRLHAAFVERLRDVRVLDPACGSGNFLYLALLALKDLEHKVNLDAEAAGLGRFVPAVGPECVKGIEINPYAAELARVTVWIGEIQWMRRNGFSASKQPILRPLETIECRDAVLNPDGTEAAWPNAEFVVGNPPFLGNKRMLSVLGEGYTRRLRKVYAGRVPGGADLVTFWFEKARTAIAAGTTARAGLVATNSIRGGENRTVLERIRDTACIIEAWSDEPWVIEGADVRVSLTCFAKTSPKFARLNGTTVAEIFSDLTASPSAGRLDLTRAARLKQNRRVSFMGITKTGPFDVDGALARAWLALPVNPNGRRNADVLFRSVNGDDIAGRRSDRWIIDFGHISDESDVAMYEPIYAYASENIKPFRQMSRQFKNRHFWWKFERPRPRMSLTIKSLNRYIGTPLVSKHRLFIWLDKQVIPENLVIVIARDDYTTFGVLHSLYHELWALRKGSSLEDRPRYTPSTTFETFPFPEGMTPDTPAVNYEQDLRAQSIAAAARRLDELREAWLNPADLVRREPEVVAGFPDRILPVDDTAAKLLKKRTLTNLYNERPAWLDHAHRELDDAVARAYGWDPGISDDDVLRRLLALNHQRAEQEVRAGENGAA